MKKKKDGFNAFVLCALAFLAGCIVFLSGCAAGVETKTRVFGKQYRSAMGAGVLIEREE